jgi:hypothetical protein
MASSTALPTVMTAADEDPVAAAALPEVPTTVHRLLT